MHAILLFSAILHLAAIGLVAALTRRAWLTSRREATGPAQEPTVAETVGTAAALGLLVLIVTTILVWMARSFGHAFATGLIAGVLTALSFLLALGALPHPRTGPDTTPTYAARVTVMALIGLLLLTETVAFSFLVTSASNLARNA